MTKKVILIILAIVIFLAVLFLPIPKGPYNDGGTREYSALTYKIVDWNRRTETSTYDKTKVYFFPENFKITVISIPPEALGRGLQIPVKAQPGKVISQDFGKFPAGSLGVQILHPQHHGAVFGTDGNPGHQRRKHIAQMHPARGGGGKTANNFFFHHSSTNTQYIATATMPAVSRQAKATRPPSFSSSVAQE